MLNTYLHGDKHITPCWKNSSVEKNFNQFYCLIMILRYKRDSKLPKVKKNLKPSWRAGGTQAENSAIFWLNWLCVSGAISKMAQDYFHILQF